MQKSRNVTHLGSLSFSLSHPYPPSPYVLRRRPDARFCPCRQGVLAIPGSGLDGLHEVRGRIALEDGLLLLASLFFLT